MDVLLFLLLGAALVLVFVCAVRRARADAGAPPEAFRAAHYLEEMLARGVPIPSVAAIDPAQILLVKYRPRPIDIIESYAPPVMPNLAALEVPGLDRDEGSYRDSGMAPAQFSHGGQWPPGMFTRLRQWEPGFGVTTGWSWGWRPGVAIEAWPRSRWVENNGSYYFVNNYQPPQGERVY